MNKVIDKGFRSCRFVSTIVKHPVLQYPNFNSASRPIPHVHVLGASKPVFNCLPDLEEDDTLRYSSTSTENDMSVDSLSKRCWLLPASLFDQAEINDLIRDFNLPK